MKLKKITFPIIGVIFIFVILIAINVQAADSLKSTIQSSKSELKKKEETVVTLTLDEYKEIKDGIYAYKATLEYDTNTFEQVLEKDFVCQNGWELLKYNKNTNEFIAIKKAGCKISEEVVSITLRTKEEIEPKQTEIKIKDIITSDGKRDINIDEARTKIDIIKEQETMPEAPEKITSQKYEVEDGYISKISQKTTISEFKQNISLENAEENLHIVFKDGSGNILPEDGKIATGTRVEIGEKLQYILVVKGDIDEDAEITINDLAQMKLHIIENTLLTSINYKAACMDEDNEVTINDLAQMKIELMGL